MVILLKIILGLLIVGDVYALINVFKDFRETRSQEGFDELPIWEKIKFNLMSFFIMSGLLSLSCFLLYFIIIKISLG
jgi:hypothetical protein